MIFTSEASIIVKKQKFLQNLLHNENFLLTEINDGENKKTSVSGKNFFVHNTSDKR